MSNEPNNLDVRLTVMISSFRIDGNERIYAPSYVGYAGKKLMLESGKTIVFDSPHKVQDVNLYPCDDAALAQYGAQIEAGNPPILAPYFSFAAWIYNVGGIHLDEGEYCSFDLKPKAGYNSHHYFLKCYRSNDTNMKNMHIELTRTLWDASIEGVSAARTDS